MRKTTLIFYLRINKKKITKPNTKPTSYLENHNTYKVKSTC